MDFGSTTVPQGSTEEGGGPVLTKQTICSIVALTPVGCFRNPASERPAEEVTPQRAARYASARGQVCCEESNRAGQTDEDHGQIAHDRKGAVCGQRKLKALEPWSCKQLVRARLLPCVRSVPDSWFFKLTLRGSLVISRLTPDPLRGVVETPS